MDIHELIELTQECLGETICAEQAGNLSSAYDYLNRLYDLLKKELVLMERPE